MFSPSQNDAPTASVRTSRRRPRPLSNEGSIALPKGKRQRLGLNEQTFLPPDAAPEMEETRNHRVAAVAKQESARETPGPSLEIAVRAKKSRSGDRGSKGDGSIVLTTNDTYTVSKLPALPDRLRADATVHQHGAIDSESGYAITLTHTHAIVWPYAVNIPSPETFTFALPQPSKHVSDPLPLGSLVSASASASDPGLVVVIPTTGKITYWESISSAATLDLRLQRNGVELSLPGLLSGETVIQILNAESAGFILAFSTGRIAYMNVRDAQGRPAISVQFLRGGNGPVNGGIFGSLRNALSSSAWRGDIAAVRAGRPEKVGERIVVLATTKGKIQSWSVHRGGHASIIAEAEGREAIVGAIKAVSPALHELSMESFETHDFTYAPKSVSSSQLSDQEDGAHLLFLSSVTHRQSSHYFLVEVVLRHDELVVGSIRPIKSYITPVNQEATSKPRIYLPNPALIAYVVFDRAVVVLSMAKQPDSPDSQLRNESHILPQSFEDVIDLRVGSKVEIVGSGMEEPHGSTQGIEDSKSRRHKVKHPAAVLLVRGGGVLRVAATDVVKLTSTNAQQVTAKSKLEQAVFFGTLDQNPLSFAVRPEQQFSAEEVGDAAMELSQEILKSQTSFIPAVAASVDQNLKKRSSALRELARYIRDSGVALSRVTKWKLLCDAERMAAASLIWKRYDAAIKEKPAGEKRGLLTEVVEFIHEDYKTEPVAEAGELDRVRHWFIKDVWNLEVAIPWAYQVIKYTYQAGHKDPNHVMNLLAEADDMVLGGLQAAFEFRTANLKLYNLSGEHLEHGILQVGYEGLPEFWTSTFFITENLRKQAELALMLLKGYWRTTRTEGAPDADVVEKVRLDYPDLVDIEIRSSTERIRWATSQDNQALTEEASQIKQIQVIAQDDQISTLAAELDLADDAINLAVKYEILPTLASVMQYELNLSTAKLRQPGLSGEDVERCGARSKKLKNDVKRWFMKFGKEWAKAFYEYEINPNFGSMSMLLDEWTEQQPYLTEFLRSKDDYAKVSWINDVTREGDFRSASTTLRELGLNHESDSWSKKIELSIGKLALLASQKSHGTDGEMIPVEIKAELSPIHDQLGLIRIQDMLYDFVLPSIDAAIDENAEIQLALEAHSNKALGTTPSFSKLFEESMVHLVKHDAMDAPTLVDLLTLIGDQGNLYEQEDFRAQQYYRALQATGFSKCSQADQLLLQKVIWRRCLLRDNWAELNNTDQKDDDEATERFRGTALYLTIRNCYQERLFEKNPSLKPMSPKDVAGAGVDELESRFSELDASTTENMMRDMQIEDNALQSMVQQCRLEEWYQMVLMHAKHDYGVYLAEETDDGKRMSEAAVHLGEVEKDIRDKEQRKADTLLHSQSRHKPKGKTNGHLGNSRQSIRY